MEQPGADMVASRKRYLERQARYNASAKGQARNLAYEERHPERKTRWPVIMQLYSGRKIGAPKNAMGA